MAERGVVERIFGGAEGEEAEAEALANGADPMAAAVAMDAARFDPELTREAAAYLRKQAHLVDLQAEHLHEQRAVQLDHLKLRRVGERMRLALQSFFVALGALIGVGFLWMVWSAANDHGLVVEAFSVPPDLAGRGLSGQVVAKQVLDRLAQLQAQTVTMRAANTYQNNWGDDLKVEVPETGVSVGEVGRYLRGVLGHETHISGEVYRTALGLTVTARVGEGEDGGDSFSGTEADYDKLLGEAAESVFSRTQPYRYAGYLMDHGRVAEARPVLQRLVDSDDAEQRAWGYVGLGAALLRAGDNRGATVQYRLAAAQKPHFAPALVGMANAELAAGYDAEAVAHYKSLLSDPSAVRREIADPSRTLDMAEAHARLDVEYGDYVDEMHAARENLLIHSARARIAYTDFAAAAALLNHDPSRASTIYFSDPTPSQNEAVLGLVALESGDPSSVDHLRRELAADIAEQGQVSATLSDAPTLAIAEARFGALSAARARVAALPADCYPCLRARGTVASYAGDRHEAERWFAEAIRQAPGLPLAYVDRGRARFRARALDGALADAESAARLGPRDPDAYGLWGDVLARRRRWGEARDKYEEALKYAPAWAAARRARDEVARRA